MAHEFKTRRIVEFAETDMAGILHFSNYFRYMEATEHEFFRSLGMSVHTTDGSSACGAARRTVECTFDEPLRYEDEVELHLVVREKRTRSITYEVTFRRPDSDRQVARGSMTVVFVRKVDGDRLEAMPIPPEVDAAIEAAPAERA